jgi:hypothetical protein
MANSILDSLINVFYFSNPQAGIQTIMKKVHNCFTEARSLLDPSSWLSTTVDSDFLTLSVEKGAGNTHGGA